MKSHSSTRFFFLLQGAKRFILLFTLHLTFCTYTHAGTTGKITGQVTDEHGMPLPGVAIVLKDTPRGTETDNDGVYFLLTIDPGDYTLVAHMIGYESQSKTGIRVTSDFTTNMSFMLKESAIQLGEILVEADAGKASGWGMFTARQNMPAVEPDKTTTKQIIRSEDIEALPTLRNMDAFIELQAGVSIDEDGDELTVRAGETKDIAYYFDGIPITSTDHVDTRTYNNFNRLAVQEMTIITGGMDAEYGNAQGGVVSIVSREGTQDYASLVDYQFTPPGKKHWGANVYDSPIHRGNNRWHDPDWVSESVTLPDGTQAPAHQRTDYTGVSGHFLEGNVSGPLAQNLSFFLSDRWQRRATVFPAPHLSTPFNLTSTFKLTYNPSQKYNLRLGGLYDKRKGANKGPDPARSNGGGRSLEHEGRNIFMVDPNPTGNFKDTDRLVYLSFTHLLSRKTFYEIKLSQTFSTRDTSNVPLPPGISHISEAFAIDPIQDQGGHYNVFWQGINWERFSRNRLSLKADFSSQATRRNFVKTGLELIRYNNWYQTYRSDFPSWRFAGWYGKTYEDTDFFPDKKNKGLNPVQLGFYVQDKIELDGMIINAGLRYDAFFQNTWVTDGDRLYGQSMSMTRARNVPVVKGKPIASLTHRIGVSHPLVERAVIRFFFGRFTQLPNFQHMFYNSWDSFESADRDLNNNGVIDSGERWNNFAQFRASDSHRQQHHSPNLPPEETTSFEVGLDWNLISDYVFTLTTYYKSANNQIAQTRQQFEEPEESFPGDRVSFTPGLHRDTRGIELNLKKRFSHMFAFNFALNLQWADQGSFGVGIQQAYPDSLFIANGHYWTTFDIDPVTGAEIPISLRDQAIREGKDPDHYIIALGGLANENIRKLQAEQDAISKGPLLPFFWVPRLSHYAAAGFERAPGEIDQSHYSEDDRKYWARINNSPNYPGFGEGNILIAQTRKWSERRRSNRNRQSFGSMTFLFASPSNFGPAKGKVLGNLRTNLVYRFYTGTPQDVFIQRYDDRIGRFLSDRQPARPGPIHTRVDLNAIKVFGSAPGKRVALGIEVFNLFNQKDPRSVARRGHQVDFNASRWEQWGIDGAPVFDAGGNPGQEIFDINNYWDQPREMTFSVQLHF